MRALALSIAVLAAASFAASAAPVKLSKDQMATVTAGQGGQKNFAPGQFPAGNPAKAGGKSNPTPPR